MRYLLYTVPSILIVFLTAIIKVVESAIAFHVCISVDPYFCPVSAAHRSLEGILSLTCYGRRSVSESCQQWLSATYTTEGDHERTKSAFVVVFLANTLFSFS